MRDRLILPFTAPSSPLSLSSRSPWFDIPTYTSHPHHDAISTRQYLAPLPLGNLTNPDAVVSLYDYASRSELQYVVVLLATSREMLWRTLTGHGGVFNCGPFESFL